LLLETPALSLKPIFCPSRSKSLASTVSATIAPLVAPMPADAEPVPFCTPITFTNAGSNKNLPLWWNNWVSE